MLKVYVDGITLGGLAPGSIARRAVAHARRDPEVRAEGITVDIMRQKRIGQRRCSESRGRRERDKLERHAGGREESRVLGPF